LQKIAKKEEEKTGIDMVPFIVSHSPKELTEMIFSDLFYKSVSTIDKIVRNKEEILKIMSLSLENVGHGIWWHLHLS
jgi:hypothetical protein